MTRLGSVLVVTAFAVPITCGLALAACLAGAALFDRRPPTDAPPGYPEEPRP